jgi:hypothetical protein
VAVTLWPSSTADKAVSLAPNTDELPEARLFVRSFSAHQIGVALVGLVSVGRREGQPTAIALAAAIDAIDVATALLEARARDRWDADPIGGILFSGAGLATALEGDTAGRPRYPPI